MSWTEVNHGAQRGVCLQAMCTIVSPVMLSIRTQATQQKREAAEQSNAMRKDMKDQLTKDRSRSRCH